MKKLLLLTVLACFAVNLFAQPILPELSKINDGKSWKIFNRTLKTVTDENQGTIVFDARQGEGLAFFQELNFENGTI